MAKTNRPLRVLVHPAAWDTAPVRDLIAKQNHVEPMLWEDDYFDLIIGPNCWRTVPDFEQGIDMAVKAARASKYPPKKKGEAE